MIYEELIDICESSYLNFSAFLLSGCKDFDLLFEESGLSESEENEIVELIGEIEIVDKRKAFDYPYVDKEIHTVFRFLKLNLFIKTKCQSDNYENPIEGLKYSIDDYEQSDEFGDFLINFYEVKPSYSSVTFSKIHPKEISYTGSKAIFDMLNQQCNNKNIEFGELLLSLNTSNGCDNQRTSSIES